MGFSPFEGVVFESGIFCIMESINMKTSSSEKAYKNIFTYYKIELNS
jgi:hypothetical protein